MRKVDVKDLIDQLDEETYNLWFAARRFYKTEGVWGSYKASHFNGGIHGLPHVRPQ